MKFVSDVNFSFKFVFFFFFTFLNDYMKAFNNFSGPVPEEIFGFLESVDECNIGRFANFGFVKTLHE